MKSLNTISHQKKLGAIGENIDSITGEENVPNEPKYLVLSQSKKAIKGIGIMSKKKQESTWRGLHGQRWGNLSKRLQWLKQINMLKSMTIENKDSGQLCRILGTNSFWMLVNKQK